MAFALTLDKLLTDALETLAPHFSAFDFEEPFTLSGDLALSKPVIATISNKFFHGSKHDPEKRARMREELAEPES